jgi:hypothetical protein
LYRFECIPSTFCRTGDRITDEQNVEGLRLAPEDPEQKTRHSEEVKNKK